MARAKNHLFEQVIYAVKKPSWHTNALQETASVHILSYIPAMSGTGGKTTGTGCTFKE